MFGRGGVESEYAGRKTMVGFERLRDTVIQHQNLYQQAEPFPHILLENMVEPKALKLIVDAFPSPQEQMSWRQVSATLEGEKMQFNKLGCSQEANLPICIRQLLWELNSGMFISLLEQLTGIRGLLPDPSLQGAGLHQMLPGGVLGIHADFTNHRVYQLCRRINVLLYLNERWQDEYEGHLELWTRDMSRCARRIRPLLGRMVIFNTDADSFHGSPAPIVCPDGCTRKSIALYYYTNGRDDKEVISTQATDWRQTDRSNLPKLE